MPHRVVIENQHIQTYLSRCGAVVAKHGSNSILGLFFQCCKVAKCVLKLHTHFSSHVYYTVQSHTQVRVCRKAYINSRRRRDYCPLIARDRADVKGPRLRRDYEADRHILAKNPGSAQSNKRTKKSTNSAHSGAVSVFYRFDYDYFRRKV